jgi:hypothetical protein
LIKMRFQNQGLKTGSFAVTHERILTVASMLLIFSARWGSVTVNTLLRRYADHCVYADTPLRRSPFLRRYADTLLRRSLCLRGYAICGLWRFVM